MDRLLIWVWGTFVALGAGTLFLTTSVPMALAVGVSAAACVWLAVSKVAEAWQERVEAFLAAARGQPIKLAPSTGDEGPLQFAREVQQAAELVRAIDEACQHGASRSLIIDRGESRLRVQVGPVASGGGSSAIVSLV